ncbi:hypothetical protein CIL05_02250 [Virgibacillus profundi]|uniref:Uncharacterized protein n=1 Tax=Virgibacillus profundi TaxID=2024555 RepID=A0A2A2IJD2_9BACI|nr:hypothetical protein [Virgibacillus profundi]PAV31498.1 hypothetical protein CIL05_02250 [Virgibacillus profundi]PXY55684.1 hypothetical protein CIT14_02260 [Virgibacillus profundi]
MSRLIVLFIAGFIGLSLRYIIIGEFELNQLLLLLLFPIASVLLLFIMKWQYNKDRDFYPNQAEKNMVTRLGDRVSTTTKQMYKDTTQLGSYHRFYHRWWKRIVADVMDNSGQWYLNLSFSLLNNDQVIFKQKNENKIHGNKEWIIYHNDKEVGTIHSDYSIKNAAKLKESLYLEYGQNTYHFKSFGIGAKTEIYNNDNTVATGNRISDSVYQLIMNPNNKHNPEMLFMVYTLFNYEFGQ